MIKCLSPYFDRNTNCWFPCSTCTICRHTRKQDWVMRLELESLAWNPQWISYVTLTYSDENLPQGNNLNYRDVQLFLKRVRKATGIRFRYFCCGEYGSKTFRPHYHMIIFGLPPAFADLFQDKWALGFVKTLPVLDGGFAYVAGYLHKKHTPRAEYKLRSRVPEMVKMSQGIGKKGIPYLIESFGNDLYGEVDVNKFFIYKGKRRMMPKYIVKKIREAHYHPDYIVNLKTAYLDMMRSELNVEACKLFDKALEYVDLGFSVPNEFLRSTISHFSQPRALLIQKWNEQALARRKL